MKKITALTLALCMLLSVLSLSVFAQDSDITFEPAHEAQGETLNENTNRMQISLMSVEEPLPSSFDARDMGWVTPVKDQLGTPLCGAFSVISALESSSIVQGFADNTVDYSEAHLGWFAHNKSTDPSDPTYGDGCTREEHIETATTLGVNFKIALHALTKWSGIALDSDYPLSMYRNNEFSDEDRYNTDGGVVIKNAEKLRTAEDIKKWIMENGSVVVTYASQCAVYHGTYYNGSQYEYEPDHAVTIIGWDDSFPASAFDPYHNLPPTDGAWLCKNSWGDNNPYFWMSYCERSLCDFAGYTVQPADAYRENYTYNGSGYAESARMPFDASAANVFGTDEQEILSAISVRTITPNQPLNISIYTDLDSDYSTPVDGTLALEMSTTIKNEGFHTIELPEDIHLDANTHFSVVVEFLTVDGYAVIPVERNSDYAASKLLTYASKPGQSYIYLQSKASWRTNTQFGIENVLIQAFTNCDHQPETTVTEPTCENEGLIYSVCTQCFEILKNEILPANGHSIKDVEWVYAGSNIYEKRCLTCNHPVETKQINISLDSTSTEMYNKEIKKITASVTGNFTNDIVYESSDTNVLTVDAYGNLKAESIGMATVTASIRGTEISAQCKITVLPRTFTVTWNIDNTTIKHKTNECSPITVPEPAKKEGYKFIGWDAPIPNLMPANDLTFTAIFTEMYICPDCENEILGQNNIDNHIAAEAKMKTTVTIKNNNGSNTICYGETLRLTAETAELPEDVKICWYVDGVKMGEGETFNLSFKCGTKTVTVKLEDGEGNTLVGADGTEKTDTETVTVKSGFFYRLISFFKDLFRISRVVEQMLSE